MAKKLIHVCDSCSNEIEDGTGATFRLNYDDARRGAKAGDLCSTCAEGMPGVKTARRGRKPKES